MSHDAHADSTRRDTLRGIIESYFAALVSNDLSEVPWHNEIVLRTPLATGGSDNPIRGRPNVEQFFAGVAPNVAAANLEEVYFSETQMSAAGRASLSIMNPECVLRVVDTFDVDASGRIVAQENHFDPRPAIAAGHDVPESESDNAGRPPIPGIQGTTQQ